MGCEEEACRLIVEKQAKAELGPISGIMGGKTVIQLPETS